MFRERSSRRGQTWEGGQAKPAAEEANLGVVEFLLELIPNNIDQWNQRYMQYGYDNSQTVATCQVGDTCRTKWQLKLDPDEPQCQSRPYLGYSHHGNLEKHKIQLRLLSCNKARIHAEFSMHIASRWSEEYSADFSVGSVHDTVIDVAFGERIQCKGKYYSEEAVDEMRSLISNFEMLFEEHLHSDVTLTSGSVRIPAHKAILAARSPVFKAMFEHECKESKTGNVVIKDVEPEVLKEMLRFMYTGKQPENMTDMAEELLPAADKYELNGLKTMCGRHMAVNLTVGNVVRILILAYTHSVANLKTATQQFIRRHKAAVMKTGDWAEMFFLYPALALETVKCISV